MTWFLLHGCISLIDGALGYEFMVSLDALIDKCEILFSAMVYHWSLV
jgi:hypothetical protein